MTSLTKPYMSFCDHLPIFNTENIHPITRSWCTSGIPMFELSFKVGKFKITTSIWTSFSFLPLKYLVVPWFVICQWNTLRKSMSLGRSPASLSDWDRTKSELRCCLASVESVTISTTFDFTGIKIIYTLFRDSRGTSVRQSTTTRLWSRYKTFGDQNSSSESHLWTEPELSRTKTAELVITVLRIPYIWASI